MSGFRVERHRTSHHAQRNAPALEEYNVTIAMLLKSCKRLHVALFFAVCLSASAPQRDASPSGARRAFLEKLVAAAVERTTHQVTYLSAYVHLNYPGGDVPPGTGVCTDEIIRSYRSVGVDLQREVHEDIATNWSAYPAKKLWGQSGPDTNIDHRRVPNLMVFFSRKGQSLPVALRAEDYSPGDLVTWDLGGNVPHIGIVVDATSTDHARHLIVHNVGQGPKMEDVLFAWKITGHYRYFGPNL
jgi:uncharacterized protein